MNKLFLRTLNGHAYLVHRYKDGGKRRDHLIPLDEVGVETLEKALQIKKEVQDPVVQYPCSNPKCKNMVPMTKKQIEKVFVSSMERYDLSTFPFCSTTCRDQTIALHHTGTGQGPSVNTGRRKAR